MAVAFVSVAVALGVCFAVVWRRARAEWRDGSDLAPATGWLILVLWALVVVLLVLAVAWRPLGLDVPVAASVVAGGLVVLGGVALAAPGFLPFASIRQLYGIERGGLITGGIYRYSRNPQYAGLGLALLGGAFAARSGLALLVAALYWLAIRAWLVIEEEHLEAAFGAKYDAYRGRAPRFLGFVRGG